jgi:cytochrome d ubiquinol oxidase subunit I
VLGQFVLGDIHARQVGVTQPAKLAAFEAKWDSGGQASLNLIALPEPSQEKNLMQIGVPGLLSWTIHGSTDAQIKGLKDFAPQDRPPVQATYWSYRVMILAAVWMAFLVIWGLILLLRGQLYTHRRWLTFMLYSLPLPILISELGWIAAEMGRQPWIVYGLMRTQSAVSPLPAYQILLTIVIITLMYAALLGALIYLMRREINKAMGTETGIHINSGVQFNQ